MSSLSPGQRPGLHLRERGFFAFPGRGRTRPVGLGSIAPELFRCFVPMTLGLCSASCQRFAIADAVALRGIKRRIPIVASPMMRAFRAAGAVASLVRPTTVHQRRESRFIRGRLALSSTLSRVMISRRRRTRDPQHEEGQHEWDAVPVERNRTDA